MKVKAIVYSSQTGSTAEYAQLLSGITGLEVYTLDDALSRLDKSEPVLYMSWLMASKLVDYKKAAKGLNVLCCCAACLNPMPQQADLTKNATDIPDEMPMFTMPGAYYPDKLHGIQKLVMRFITKLLVEKFVPAGSEDAERALLRDVLTNGGSLVRREHLDAVCAWLAED